MKNEKLKNRNAHTRMLQAFLFFNFAFLISLCRAEDFGDISVSAQAMYSGSTFHGYAETRVQLKNRSPGKSHSVTLAYPNNSWNSGNSLSRVSRTVSLAPGVSEIVSLLQPPLPINGDSQIRVAVDNHFEGNVRAPNANNHISAYNRGGSAVVFISRSLDSEMAGKIFSGNRTGFTAAAATGPPNSRGRSGAVPTAWMPDTRRSGDTNWLELDYATPQVAQTLNIYSLYSLPVSGEIILLGSSGTNLAKIPMTSGFTPSARGNNTVFSFPPTREPVKTVHLNFGTSPPSSIAVDAVEISGPAGRSWASDARASSDNSAAAPTAPSPSFGGSSDTIESLRAESAVSEWSENWLAYTPFDAIALDAADFNSMPPAVLAAIGNYLEAGGNVFIFGGGDFPAAWRSAQKKSMDDGVEYRVGLGSCFVSPTKNFSMLSPKTFQFLRDALNSASRYWQVLPADSSAANAALPVIENLKIPVRGIVIIMLAFVIVIGPANIIILNRRKRRTWMLWTIPVISFATTLIVFAYSLLREGITPDTRITGVTVLDQINHHAATVGATAFYCPLTPSGGLRFDDETEVTPLVHVGYDRSGASREVDWTQTQHFQHGWVSARVPAHFHLRKSETRRERIQIVNENGKLQVVNGLGAPIKSLWVADAEMNFYEAENVAAGQKAGLILSKQSQASEKSGAEGLLREISFAAHLDSLGGSAEKFLLPNTYIAVLDGNPFIENALGSASSPKRTKSSAVVFGILESDK